TLLGSWSVRLGRARISAGRTDRPLTVAIFSLLVLFLTSATFINIVRRRSTFAFYTIAAVITWALSLCPAPRLFGQSWLYRGPYALLMLFPGFDYRFRAPARFAMITALGVATAAGVGLVRITAAAPRSVRVAGTLLLFVAIAADSWTFTCP